MQSRDPFAATTFGDLLKGLRKRQRLSQQQLAAQLGIHRNTIGTWERGDFLPDSKGMVLELARQLHLEGHETRQLLEASLTALSSYWYVPYPRNPFFTGREELLHELHVQRTQTREGGCTALSGLAGVGKTQLALEYAYLHAEEYSAVLWCNASTRDTLLAAFQDIARILQLTPTSAQMPFESAASVLHWLTNHTDWLLIFDNVEDLAQLAEFLPSARAGSILLTTHLTTLQGLGYTFHLQPFTCKEGQTFLLERLRQHALSTTASGEQNTGNTYSTDIHLDALVEALGGLPLALDQAATYIEATQCQPEDFLRLLEAHPVDLLQSHFSISGHPLSVLATFRCTFEQVQRQHPPAADLLVLCSFLAGESIPEEILRQGGLFLESGLHSALTDPLQYNTALKILLAYSLIGRSAHERTLSIHRLVQMVLRESLSPEKRRHWLATATYMLDQLFPLDLRHDNYWQTCEQLLPHVIVVLQQAEQWMETSHTIALLQAKVASYLLARTRYEEAEPFGQHAQATLAQLAEHYHPDMIYILSNQATLSIVLGHYTQALHLLQQAVQVSEWKLDHPYKAYAAYCLSKLAALYSEMNQPEQAETLFQQALHHSRHLLAQEAEHPLLAISFCELAQLCMQRAQLQQAETLFQQVIQLCEQSAYREQLPHLAISLSNLASLYFKQGRYQEAQACTQRFSTMSRQSLRSRHPYLY